MRNRVSATLLLFLLFSSLSLAGTREVSGPVEGVWNSDQPYHVVGDITVENGKSLSILAGTVVQFEPGTRLTVHGGLQIKGSSLANVSFEPVGVGEDFYWNGIHIINAGSMTGYIEHLEMSGCTSGFFLENSAFDVRDSRITVHWDQGSNSWGAFYLLNSQVDLEHVNARVTSEMAQVHVVNARSSNLNISDDSFFSLKIEDAQNNTEGRGIILLNTTGRMTDSQVWVESNSDDQNHPLSPVVGVSWNDSPNYQFDHNGIRVIAGHALHSTGIRIQGEQPSNVSVNHCSIALIPLRGNASLRGIEVSSASQVEVVNTIIADTTDLGFGQTHALHAWDQQPDLHMVVSYCDFFGIEFPDSSDLYEIYMSTMLVEAPMWIPGSFELQEVSPCIDAARPDTSDRDPDGTAADIGMYYYYQDDNNSGVYPARELPAEFGLTHAYPNPFNSTVRIDLNLPRPGQVEVVVFNSLGRQVATLTRGSLPAGVHNLVWNSDAAGARLASGVYFIQAQTQQQVHTERVVLLR